MTDETLTELSFPDLLHEASNEALSISIGIHVLRSIPTESLSPAQIRALKHIEDASHRLIELMEGMQSSDGSCASNSL